MLADDVSDDLQGHGAVFLSSANSDVLIDYSKTLDFSADEVPCFIFPQNIFLMVAIQTQLSILAYVFHLLVPHPQLGERAAALDYEVVHKSDY